MTTTTKQATEVIDKIVKPVYKNVGFAEHTKKLITAYLTDPEQMKTKRNSPHRPSFAAENVRNALWSYGGGATSAAVTTEIFTALGRENELDYIAEEGKTSI